MEPHGSDTYPAVDGVEEILDVGVRRPPSRWRAALTGRVAQGAGAVVIAVAVLVALLSRHPSATPSAAPSTSTVPAATNVEPQVEQVVRSLAAEQPGLADYDRSSSARGACVLVQVGSAPQTRAAALIKHTFAGFGVVSVTRTIDEFGQLCELHLVARDAHGTTIVARVVSPSQARADRPASGADTIAIGGDSDGSRSVSYVTVETTQGWSVLIGSVGPVRDQPAANDMFHVADDPTVRW